MPRPLNCEVLSPETCAEVIAPRAAELDRTDAFPHDIYGRFNELGLVGLLVPEELGGAGGTLVEMSLLYKELPPD